MCIDYQVLIGDSQVGLKVYFVLLYLLKKIINLFSFLFIFPKTPYF